MKKRELSDDIINETSDDCIMIPLTSVLKEAPYSIQISQENLILGKLIKPSSIRVDKIFTLEKSLIMMKIGKISNMTFEEIKAEINKIF